MNFELARLTSRIRMSALSATKAVSSSFWFLPSLIALGSLGLAWATISWEGIETLEQITPRSFTAEGARTILGTIAGAVMTVGGVVFSLTFVALSVVAQQLGPRVVYILMRDRMTQVTLGVFIATFLHSLITLTAVSSSESASFVPSLAVLVAVGLAVVSFALVIRFVHAMAMQIQADAVIAHLADDLDRAIRHTAIAESGEPGDPPQNELDEAAEIRAQGRGVLAERSGYVQSIDMDAAVRMAEEADVVLALACGPGDFVLKGAPVAYVRGADDDEIAPDFVALGPRRTSYGNIVFELNALIDVALRALSPSLNDPNTAIACFNHLADGLLVLARQPMRSLRHCGEDERVRAYAAPRTFVDHLDTICRPLVPAAASSALASDALKALLESVIDLAPTRAQTSALIGWRTALTRLAGDIEGKGRAESANLLAAS